MGRMFIEEWDAQARRAERDAWREFGIVVDFDLVDEETVTWWTTPDGTHRFRTFTSLDEAIRFLWREYGGE
jgi:hypothetical protein